MLTARAGTVRGPYGQIWHPCGIFANCGCVNSLTCPWGRRTAPLRVKHGPRTGIWKSLKIPARGPYGHRTGYPWSPANYSTKPYKYADVSSHTGPVAWCDHGNSIDVKFLRAFHSALRARNCTGDKNRTGPVVGCDWGIRNKLQRFVNQNTIFFRRTKHAYLIILSFCIDLSTKSRDTLVDNRLFFVIVRCV